MYGDAPYADRPYADVENLVGFADGYLDASATFKYVIYAATSEFASNFDDSVEPNRPYRGTLTVPLGNIRRSIIGSSELGTFTTGDGTTVLDNADGAYDDLPEVFTADGRPIAVKVMRRGDDLAEAFTVFKGVMASWFIDETQVAVQVRDFGYKLNVPAQPNIYAGTGGAEGGSDVAGKRKPLGVGAPQNVSAVLINAASLIYQLHDGAVTTISAVYDRGVSLTAGSNYASYAALAAAAVPVNTFATCKAQGLFRLGSNAAGQVTGDFATSVNMTADAVRFFVEHGTDLVYADDFYDPSFNEMNATQPAPIDYWLGPDDSETVADVCANLARGIGGWCGFRRNGLFEIRRLIAPGSGVLVAEFSRVDIATIKREPLPNSLTPPPWRYRVAWGRNWTVQSDLAGSVSATRKAFVGVEARLAEASAQSILTDHPFAQDPQPLQTYFRNQADAAAEALRLLNRDRVERAFYRCEVPRRGLYLNLGDECQVAYPRWDLSVGRSVVLVETNENIQAPRDGQVDTVGAVFYG